jgi:hypothetical protein
MAQEKPQPSIENDIPVEIARGNATGLNLLGPREPSFATAVPLVAHELADSVLRCRPYASIVSNGSVMPVVAYGVLFETKLANGLANNFYIQMRFPEAVLFEFGQANDALMPGAQSVITPMFDLDVKNSQGRDAEEIDDLCRGLRSKAKGAVSLKISIDAAIFSDGSIVGADAHQVGLHFAKHYEAMHAIYDAIFRRMDTGQSFAEALDIETRQVTGGAGRPQALPDPRVAANLLSLYTTAAKGEIAGRWYARKHEPDLGNVLRRTIRRSPFTLHR